MKVVLLALNAKYIHTSLALRYIKSYCKDYESHITILETTINNNETEMIKAIYKEKPDIIGISCYIWNMSFVKTLIPTLRKLLPHTTLVLGGPEVSYEGDHLFEALDIDLVMEGEGEETWKQYLDYRIQGKGSLHDINGIIYKKENVIIKNAPRQPLDLKHLPFVYDSLEGLEHKIIYYEASRGCPFNCQYCLSSTHKGVRFVPLERVKMHLTYFLEQRVKQVKFVDRTFNTKKAYAMAIWEHIIANDNGSTNFHFEIAAELIDDDMLELLKGARNGLIQFEIGVQSTNMKVLEAISRKMPYEDIKEITRKIKALGNIHQHLDLIAGLPYEDYASFRNSFNDVIALRPEQFQLGFLKLLKGSGLRKSAETYGLIYKDEPPYEILYTKEMNFDEMLKLHSIEELLERYYNSGRFHNSLEYLFTCFKSPFDFFEALMVFWEEQGYDLIQHNKLAYYLHLITFAAQQTTVNSELLKEYIRLDYILHEPIREMPEAFETLNRASYKVYYNDLLKDDLFIMNYLPNLSDLVPRQRYKETHLEYFRYNVWENYLSQTYDSAELLQIPMGILFDYSSSPIKGILIEKE